MTPDPELPRSVVASVCQSVNRITWQADSVSQLLNTQKNQDHKTATEGNKHSKHVVTCLPITDWSVAPAVLCGLVNFCTNRTPLRTIEARSFDIELLGLILLSAAYIFQPNKTGNLITEHKVKKRQLNAMCRVVSMCQQVSAVVDSISRQLLETNAVYI